MARKFSITPNMTEAAIDSLIAYHAAKNAAERATKDATIGVVSWFCKRMATIEFRSMVA